MKTEYINQKYVISIFVVFLTILCAHTVVYADITPVNERTPQVRYAIVNAIPNINTANEVTETHLAAITTLNLRAKSITTLKSGDFSGLIGLINLNLYGNMLSSLPDGIFEGLSALTTLRLGGNTVDPMATTVSLEKVGEDQFKAVVPTGAPFAIVLPISVINGNISGDATTITITKGSVESEVLTVTRTAGTTDAVTVDIGILPHLPRNHYGYVLSKSDALPLEVIGAVATDNTDITPIVPEKPAVTSLIVPEVPINTAPVFTDGTIAIRAVAENTTADMKIGAAVSATDVNNDEITYNLSGTDADSFDIDSTTGQLKTKAVLDYETKRVYVVTITASDGNLTDTISVIISIIDVNDTPLDSMIVPVSERTPEVRDAIVAALSNVDAAVDVTTAHLATITRLNLRNTGMSKLKSGDFSGLTALTNLNLHGNMLSGLPNGIFNGLTSLTTLRLGGNLADPISLVVSLQQIAVNEYRVMIPAGAPFDVVVPINGTSSTTMVTIPKGSVKSTSFTVMNNENVNIGALPLLPQNHFGYVVSKSTVCYRTLQVVEAITAVVPGVTDCRNISETQLATITNLDLNNKGITSLNRGDFAGMLSLTSLDLRNNQLSRLPDGIFEGLTALTTLHLDGNTVDPFPILISLERMGENQFKAVVPTGAPFAIVLPLNVANGEVSTGTNSIKIPPGSSESSIFTITRTEGTKAAVTVNIGAIPALPATHTGYALAKTGTFPIEVFSRINSAPVFTEGDNTTREVLENTASSENIGDAIAATDVDNDTLTYSLSGTDIDAFGIDSTSGQLKTKAALDYETKKSYSVTITVSDGTLADTISVTINVTDIDENRAPVFTDGVSTTREVAENTASGKNIGDSVSATDADNDTLTYSLSGTDAAAFAIDTKYGQLKTKAALDYETKSSHAVTITVSDGKLTDSITVTINITDVDEVQTKTEGIATSETKSDTTETDTTTKTDTTKTETTPINNAPVFTDGDSTTREVAENTGSGVDIGGAVSATDEDDDTLTYVLVGGVSNPDAAAFDIDSTSGQLRTSDALDFETKSSYSVTITVSDGNGGSDSITVTINVTDVEEAPTNNAPEFTEGDSTTRSIAENTGSGVDIGTAVSAIDADDDTLTYVLVGGVSNPDAAAFDIDSTSGQLRTSAVLDYETQSSYSVTITVSDGNGGSDSITVTINVTDVEEAPTNNAPVFSTDSIRLTVAENTDSDADIGAAITATDVDDDTLTYSLGGTDASSFSIDTDSGQLKTSTALNFESKSSYSVSVTASDGTDTDNISVTINVTNVNEAPEFTDGDSTTRAIAENVGVNINIGSAVSATDPEGSKLTWTLGGTNADSFSIDTATGQLKTKATLDFETKSSYSVTLTVTDGSFTDTITVTINVTNLDETPSNNPPVFTDGTSTTRSIAENTAADKNIGTPITATDADNNTLAYLLSGADAAAFSIVSTTGQLKTSAALNHEDKSSYTVVVTVTDGSGTDTITVTINVTDVNEAPVIAANTKTTLSIAENTATGVNIGGPLSATDPDTDDELSYSLGGTDAAVFSIVDTSGQLQTQSALDFETKASYSVKVTVSDGILTDSVDITINVSDVDENRAPVFADGESTTRSVAENTGSGVNIGAAVSATDADNDELTYTLGGTNAFSFSIDSSSGQLRTKAVLDYETKTSYSVTITVSDGNGKSDSITVTINVSDINENRAPVFMGGASAMREVAENTAAGEDIGGAVGAIDADNDKLTYTLGGTDADAFSINSETGQLRTKTTLDFETKNSYSVTMTVSDGTLTDTIDITINVTDVDENRAPVFTEGESTTRSVAENTTAGGNIGDPVAATDADNDTLTYTFVGGVSNPDNAAFDIVSTTGQLQTKAVLNYETKKSYSVTITVSDGNGGTDSITVTINVTDVTEITPLSDRTQEVQDAIVAALPDIDSVDDVTASRLATITNLNLSDDSISSLKDGDFSGLTALTRLKLDGNALTSLPAGIFDELTRLQTIDLDSNGMTSLPAGIFDELTELTRIDLEYNRLTSLPAGIFDELTKLQTLRLEYNRLTSLPAGVFDGLTKLKILRLGENALTSLPTGIFDELTELTDIVLNRNALTSLPTGIFDELTKLTNLNLSRNALTSLPTGIFDKLTKLLNLALSHNELTSLPTGIFDELTKLAHNALDNNDISDVSELQGLTSLTVLHLSGNTISDYGPLRRLIAAIEGNGSTLSLDITIPTVVGNNAPTFTDSTSTTRSVAENTAAGENIGDPVAATDEDSSDTLTYTLGGTDASSFSIVSTSGQLQTSAALDYETKTSYSVTITVSDGNGGSASITVTINVTDVTEITSLSERTPKVRDAIVAAAGVDSADDVTPEHLAQITDLSLYNKKMNTLKVGDFSGMSALRNLSLYYTGLKSLPAGVFDENTELRYIELGACYFKTLPAGIFDNNTKLTNLSFGGGGLTSLRSDVFANNTKLTRIHLFSNDLTSLPAGVFDNNTELGELTLNKNNLTSLPAGVFDNNTKLKTLYLYGNNLTSLSAGVFDNNTKLLQLFLNDTGLTALPTNVFDNNTKLSWLYLDNNSLTSLPANVFDNNTELTVLLLNDNDLTSLPAGVFGNNTKLVQLSLNYNDLTALPTNPFSNLTQLTKLELAGNDLTSLPDNVFDNNTNLKTLYLYGNNLTSLPDNVFDNNTKLVTLWLYGNDLTTLPADVFDNNTKLKELSVDNNHISDVSEFEGLTSLKTLDISGNPISDYGPLRRLKAARQRISIDINLNNNIPMFTDGDSATRSVAENTEAGQNIGEPVSATDADSSDTLTYSLSGTDVSSFSIVSTSGQLQTKAALDYETKTSYSVTVSVYDGNSGGDSITLTINVTDIEGAAPSVQTSPVSPETTVLLPNFPNPFNPETWIPYQLAKPSGVTITIYDIRGNVVRRLELGHQKAGFYTSRNRAAHWNGKNELSEKVAAGVYFYQLQADYISPLRKMVILK